MSDMMTKPEGMSEEEWSDLNIVKDTVRNEKLRIWEYLDCPQGEFETFRLQDTRRGRSQDNGSITADREESLGRILT